MKKVKFFSAYDEDDLEDAINKFLAESTENVIDIKFSMNYIPAEENREAFTFISAMVYYVPKKGVKEDEFH